MNKDKLIKTIRNIIIFVILIALTFSILLKDKDPREIWDLILHAKIEYIILGILSMCLYFLCEAINVKRILSALGEKLSIFKAIKFSLIGFFFSSITPAASGGQPMEIYYMHKEKHSVANATLTLLLQLCFFQIVTISFGLVCAFIHRDLLHDGLTWLFLLGIGLNTSALILFSICVFSKRLSKFFIKLSVKFLKFIKYKKVDQKEKSLYEGLEKYQASSVFIKQNKGILIKSLLTAYIQLIAYYSISYFSYKALGLEGHNWFDLITVQALLYCTVSGIPSPGAVGINEWVYLQFFGPIFGETLLASGMLLNRGMNFYLFVIISVIVTFINSVAYKNIIVSDTDDEIKEEVKENNKEIIKNNKKK